MYDDEPRTPDPYQASMFQAEEGHPNDSILGKRSR